MTLAWLKQRSVREVSTTGRPLQIRRRLGGLLKRLTVVGRDGSSNIRLVDTFFETESGIQGLLTVRYTTLRHRWRDFDMFKTTHSNLANHQQSISMSSLSQGFQDAIVVMSKMEERYLWIDALCIV
jgi:hypothetical protein